MLNNLDYIDFYGEDAPQNNQALLYCEALSLRSEQHNWTIQPHRHRQITQIFVITQGGVEVQLDAERHRCSAPHILYIPDGIMHGFEWQAGSQGYVLSVASPLIQQVNSTYQSYQPSPSPALVALESEHVVLISRLCEQIQQETTTKCELQGPMLLALLQQVLIWMARLQPQVEEDISTSKSERKLHEFKHLIDKHFTEYHQVSWYANQIGVSQAHLNQLCQQYLQTNALSLIHKVIINEAKRFLIFADMPVASIAERLGFNEPTYFNKFFKRYVNMSPAVYRRQTQ